MERKLVVLPFLLLFVFLFYGCAGAVNDARGTVTFNSDGSGSGQFSVTTSSTYADRVESAIRSGFSSKKNFNLASNPGYNYVASFDFDSPTGITAYSRFEKFTEPGWAFVYRYTDSISMDTITGQHNSDSLPFSYCVQMPIGTTVRKVTINGVEYPPASPACAPIASGNSVNLIVEAGVEAEKIGCAYANPPCKSDQDCISNNCVLKRGCQYNNPPCDDRHNCINNNCVLKPGCAYNNPSCDSSHNCIDNQCILKDGCAYHNPDCSGAFQICNDAKNRCEFDFCGVFPISVFLLTSGLVVAALAFIVFKVIKTKWWQNPKKIIAIVSFVIAGMIVVFYLLALVISGTCIANQLGYVLGSILLIGPALFCLLIFGAFIWSGAKKDDLRDLEIEEYKKGQGHKVNKKTEAI